MTDAQGARVALQPGPLVVPPLQHLRAMPELRQCRTCSFDYVASPGGRHDCARFRGAIKVKEPALAWIREQVFDQDGLPKPEADGCPGWSGWSDTADAATGGRVQNSQSPCSGSPLGSSPWR